MTRLDEIAKAFLIMSVALALLLVSCQPAAPAPQATPLLPTPTATTARAPESSLFPLTVTKDSGRALILAAAPKRIVSLSPGHTEVLFAIGASDLVVGADNFSDYPPETAALPKVDYSQPNLEQLVALEPDLVIAVTQQKAAVSEMEKLGLPVLFRAEPATLDAVIELVRLLGKITDRQEQAEGVAEEMQKRVDAIQRRLDEVSEGPTVFYELSPQLHTVGPNSFIGDILARLKVRNIAAGLDTPYPKLSQEKIIADNPEVVILADASAGESPKTVRARPGWDTLRAVQQGRILVVPDRDIIHRPGPRVVEGMEFLARGIYPELFK